jgi:uncharacterized transporter YbjL
MNANTVNRRNERNDMNMFPCALAFGVFVGNWLVVPLILPRTFKEGFAVGLIAAILVLGFYWVAAKFGYKP